ncbi:cell division protein FtsX [Aestuariispira insulae]|uniref:Cell division transport system permease protein n=1 Tax=Aestuariispira insulae TaxID=1461337 RepID=A0A3D9H7W9_9PROT|nr:FtsX-like permease family protein [Aestuariispira insulae]RED45056.1 cell division transport system permease protein [Aestuariispira insulae]
MIFARATDIPLARDPSTRLVPWVIGFMVFLAILAVAGGVTLAGMAAGWQQGLTGSMTVQVPPLADDSDEETEQRVRQALEVLRRTRGLGEVNLLPSEDMVVLLEPWLGGGVDPDSLPLPRLIDVVIDDADDLDMDDVRRRLAAAVPGAALDDHQLWRERMVGFLELLQLVAWSVVAVVAACAIVMVVFATRSGLAAHRRVIETLHLIGARDGYIARQFQLHATRSAFKGSLVGALFGTGIIFGLLQMAHAMGNTASSLAVFGWQQWLILTLVPILGITITALTARVTVMQALSRLV